MIDTRDSSLFGTRNPMEGEVRIPSGCAIAGIFHKKGGKIGGDTIIRAMEPMHDRSNGLGGGFAGYGIYPDFADCYAFHMFYDNESARDDCEHYLKRFFDIHSMSVMPTRPMREITDPPIIWRYFVTPKAWRCQEEAMDEDAFTAAHVLHVNVNIPGAFIFSSGKNMGVFKGVGYPEDMGRFYPLGGIRRDVLDGARALSDEHPWLVGRRAPVHAAGCVRRPQWRNLLLRREPPLHGDVRLHLHADDRH